MNLGIAQNSPGKAEFQYVPEIQNRLVRLQYETLERKRCYGEEIPKTNRSGEAMSSGGEETKNL